MTHIKRINAPKSWPIERKVTTFVTKPLPGTHKLEEGMALGVIIREILKLAKTKRHIKFILNNKNILVDNKVRKEYGFSVGIMDSISILPLDKHYRVMYDKRGKLELLEIHKNEINYKICKVIGKKILKKSKIQLNLYGGKNLIVDKNIYNVRDSIIINNDKIVNYLKFEKGALIYLIGGKHVGCKGILVDFKKSNGLSDDIVLFKINDNLYETIADYAYVLEK